MKIGILIPSTSRGRDWSTYKETYLYQYTLKTFLLHYDKEHQHTFYIGIDKNDPIYDHDDVKMKMKRFISIMKNVDIEFIYMDGITKGHLTVMWNRLFDKAFDDGCDYFFQCGDDIEFKTSGWINECIQTLAKTNDYGLVGPINNNNRILTQSFVSRKHMELFGFYFPPEIINWCCDDWINDIYKRLHRFFPLQQHLCINIGGDPRYIINNDNSINETNLTEHTKLLRDHCRDVVDRCFDKIKADEKYVQLFQLDTKEKRLHLDATNMITEDAFIDWVQSQHGLLITRRTMNIQEFSFHDCKETTLVCITGYPHLLSEFFTKIIHCFSVPIILLIVESDVIVLKEEWLCMFQLKHCFTWNKPFHHPKLSALPIGLNYCRQYHSLHEWLTANPVTNLFQEKDKDKEKEKLLCMNYSPQTNVDRVHLLKKAEKDWTSFCDILPCIPSANSYFMPSHIESQLCIHVTDKRCYDQWKQYKFVISPPGAGFDCHRTWEALYVGCIPIVLSSTLNELYAGLPILIVDSWDQINETFLLQQYDIIRCRHSSQNFMEQLRLGYWTRKISDYSNYQQKIHFITYGDKKFEQSKQRLLREADVFQEFSSIRGYGPEDLPPAFQETYKEILSQSRGGGYWIWRPIILHHALSFLNENDILIYLDAGCTINSAGKSRFYQYIDALNTNKEQYGVLSFQMTGKMGPGNLEIEKKWTTKQIFDHFQVDMETKNEIANTGQYLGGILMMKKNTHLKQYMERYLSCVLQNPLLCTDHYNVMNQVEEFRENRHEQSITSVLRKLMGSVVIDSDESWMPPFGEGESLAYPFWATRIRK